MTQRTLRITLAALLIASLGAMGAVAPAAAASRVARVALIVGPAGAVTSRYRALADQAAVAARKAGAQVVKVYSPNATWPAVRAAVEGASIVVYLGHGNGWPSPYRDALYPPTQNGFGLNPVAGNGDSTHQYFGEKYIEQLRLATNAVVVFSHLCYASGNSEPGLPEGTQDQAIRRVDNYAAGFLRAGARAVVAEAYLAPSYYVSALLKGQGSVESIWSAAPTANGHAFAVASARSPGYSVQLDPDHAASGYVRSLVSRGVTAAQLRAGAVGTQTVLGPVAPPSLARAGIRFGEPAFRLMPIAGTSTRLTVPLTTGSTNGIPKNSELSVRWDPILLDPDPSTAGGGGPATPVPAPATPTPEPSPSSSTSAPAAPPADPARVAQSPAPAATTLPAAPAVDLVVPEQAGSVVEPARARRTATGLELALRFPARSGLYRMSLMIHTPDGVAYDAATQGLLVPVMVRVGGPVSAAYGVSPTVTVSAGTAVNLPVRIQNTGSRPWDIDVVLPPATVDGRSLPYRTEHRLARLVGTWVSTTVATVPAPVSVVLEPDAVQPGSTAEAIVPLIVPTTPGDYLLVLDVLAPAAGAMSSLGTAPAIVRVSVTAAPDATPTPAPTVAPGSSPAPPVEPAVTLATPAASTPGSAQ